MLKNINIQSSHIWMGAIILILAFLIFKTSFKNKEYVSTIENLKGELKITKDSEGRQSARIDFVEAQNVNQLLKIRTSDFEVKELQSLVEKYKSELKKKGSATIIKGETVINTITKEVIVKGDSIYPTYIGTVNLQEWVVAKIEASKDSIGLDLKVKNDYLVVIGREKSGFLGLGKGTPFVEVTNNNPYTETKSIITYSVTDEKPRKFGVGIIAGYGVTAVNIVPQPMLGVGLSYNLIRF